MDLFPAGTNIVACSRPFVEHGMAVAGRVFAVPFAEVCGLAGAQVQAPFRCSAHSNEKVAAFAPRVQSLVTMGDLNLRNKSKGCH